MPRTREEIEPHITAVGVLTLVLGGILLLATLGLAGIAGVQGVGLTEMLTNLGLSTAAGVAVTALILIVSLIGIVGGIGVLRHASWGRYLTFAFAVLMLFNFPLGTAYAIYAFWIITRDPAEAMFAAESEYLSQT